MHVLHLVPSVGQDSGGLGPIALGLARAQRTLEHSATIWCYNSPDEVDEVSAAWDLQGSVNTYPLLGPSFVGYSPIAEHVVGSQSSNRYDLIHQHSIWMANSRVGNRWRETFKRPTVVAPQGALEQYVLKLSRWKKRLALLGYETRNLLTTTCLQATAWPEVISFRNYGIKNPIAVIPNGIPDSWLYNNGDVAKFRNRYSIPSDKRLMLFLSRLHPKKGLPMLFEAISCIRQYFTDWYLVVAGPDELNHQHELLEISEKLGIMDLLQFTGPLFGKEKQDAFASAEIFVLPTYAEGAPVAVVEALAAGVPVLTTRGAPWEELLTHRCGWWVDVNTAAIKDALLDAIHRPREELVEMGQRGRTLIQSKYTWKQIAQQSILLYEWLLGRADRPDFVIID